MQCTPPPGVLVPFTVFLQCISSLNPKISCRMHAPYNSKITGTMLGIRSPGPPSRDVFLFPRVLLSPLLNHYKAPILDTINVFSLVRIKVFTKKHGYDILGGLASRQTPHVGPKWLKNCAGTGCFIGRCIRFHHCNQDINCYKWAEYIRLRFAFG